MKVLQATGVVDSRGRIKVHGVKLRRHWPVTLRLDGGVLAVAPEADTDIGGGREIPYDVLTEAGIRPDSALQFDCRDGRIIVEAVSDEEFDRACGRVEG